MIFLRGFQRVLTYIQIERYEKVYFFRKKIFFIFIYIYIYIQVLNMLIIVLEILLIIHTFNT